jgi:hypothetical protein
MAQALGGSTRCDTIRSKAFYAGCLPVKTTTILHRSDFFTGNEAPSAKEKQARKQERRRIAALKIVTAKAES